MDLKDVVAELERKGRKARPRGSILMALPIYNGAFAARFRALLPEDIAGMGDLFEPGQEEDPTANAEASCTFIADACRRIETRNSATGEWEPVTVDGQPVRFDIVLAESLGLELHEESGAAVVRAVWTSEGEDGEPPVFQGTACASFGQRLLDWMQDPLRQVEGAIVGKSQSGTTSSAPVVPLEPESTHGSLSPSQTEG